MNSESFSTKRIAEGYAKRPWLHKNVIEAISPALGGPFRNGLDVGCGAGLSTKALRLICRRVTGTDISKDMINVCKALYQDEDYAFYVAKAEETKLPEEKYDIITAAGVINWVERNAFLKNAGKVMTEGGKLVIYDFWISDQMIGVPDYTKWYDEAYLEKFPKPPRNEEVWEEKDMEGIFHIREQKDFEVTYPFSEGAFADFMMIQSNVNERIRKEEISVEEARAWMKRTLAPFFEGQARELVFKGYYWLIEKTPAE